MEPDKSGGELKIVTIQTGQGSSGDSSYRHTEVFARKGLKASLVVGESIRKSGLIHKVGFGFLNFPVVFQGILNKRIYRWTDSKRGTYSFSLFGRGIHKEKEIIEADIVIVAWSIGGFLNLKSYRNLLKLNKPVVFIMRDMWLFTGGCHHSFECDSFTNACGNCPVFDTHGKFFARKLLDLKQKVFGSFDNYIVVGPSKWIVNRAKSSALFKGKRVLNIPNFVPTDLFKKMRWNVASEYFDIDSRKFVIGFGAKGGVDNPYKGFSYLIDALKVLGGRIDHSSVHLLIYGAEENSSLRELIPFEMTFTGFIYDDRAMSLCYNAMDVFVVPSVADNLPSTVLESLASGTPVVGFKTGGIPEMIEHKSNGYLANYKDFNDLANGIQFVIENETQGFLLDQFHEDNVFREWKGLFEQLTGIGGEQ